MVLRFVPLALLALACTRPPSRATGASSPPITVWADANLHPGAREAVAAWAFTTEGVRDWAYVNDPDDSVIRMSVVDAGSGYCHSPRMLACVSEIGGAWRGEPINVWFIAGQYEGALPLVAMHEIGHALGLTHQDLTIMQAEVSGDWSAKPWRCPDPVSVARLESELGVEGLRACELPEP